LALRAGTGITIETDLTGSASGSAFVIDADYESPGDGTLPFWDPRLSAHRMGLSQ